MSEAMLDRTISGADASMRGEAQVGDAAIAQPGAVRAARSGTSVGSVNPRRRRHMDEATAVRSLPRGDLSEFQRSFRHWFSRTLGAVVIKSWFRVTIVNPDRFVQEPAVYCFNHLSWMDTLVIVGLFPSKPRLYMYGPMQEDIEDGGRNKFMWWTGIPVPFSPKKDDMLTSVKRAQAVFDSGGVLAIAGEGTIHVHEGDLLRFEPGAAYLALRAGVPIVPVAITGTSWAHFRGRVLVRLGNPIETGERPTRQTVARYTARIWHAIRSMVADDRDLPPPGPIGRWLTDVFNDWGPGGRPAASLLHGPDPADVPFGPDSTSSYPPGSTG